MTERKGRAGAPKRRPQRMASKPPEAPTGWLTVPPGGPGPKAIVPLVPEHDAERREERQP